MDKKMPWLKLRLRQINKTPAGLSRHLKIDGPRVYEMISGRRNMQPTEIRPTAAYLEWSIEELIAHLPEPSRILPTADMGEALPLAMGRATIPVFGTIMAIDNGYDAILTGRTTHYVGCAGLESRKDIFCIYLANRRMMPWRGEGELIMVEKERPPRENDHVVIWMMLDNEKTTVTVRQLVRSKDPRRFRLRQHNPGKETTVSRRAVSSMYRVMTWDDVIR